VKATTRQKLSRRKRRIQRRPGPPTLAEPGPSHALGQQYPLRGAGRGLVLAAGASGPFTSWCSGSACPNSSTITCTAQTAPAYHESDHVMNIAYNVMVGGTCLEDLELRRHDEAYLNALGPPTFLTRRRPATSAAASKRCPGAAVDGDDQ